MGDTFTLQMLYQFKRASFNFDGFNCAENLLFVSEKIIMISP